MARKKINKPNKFGLRVHTDPPFNRPTLRPTKGNTINRGKTIADAFARAGQERMRQKLADSTMDFQNMPNFSLDDLMLRIQNQMSNMNMPRAVNTPMSPSFGGGTMPSNMMVGTPRRMMATGDEAKPDFLDFDKDGDKEESMKQALQQKNKMAAGDEVNMMLMEMESADDEVMPTEASVDEGMMELEGMQPEMQMLDQYVQQVVQMIQAGASEQEVIEMLMQAGLDEEDINAIFQAVLELLQSSMQANPIDDQLAQIS